MADVGGLELGELLGVLVDQTGEAEQDALALERIGQRPDAVVEGPSRRPDRAVDVLGRPPRHVGQDATVAWGHILEHPTVGRRDEPPVDERLGPQASTAWAAPA
jgi:hypothetical protein